MHRISLVLGAGGPVGHAFHAGVLRAFADTFGWDPRRVGLIVGTSAGAQVGALLRAGMSAHDLAARVTGDRMSSEGAAIARHYVRPSHDRPASRARPYRPSSPGYLMHTVRRPWVARPGRFVSALLPHGDVSLEPQAAGFRALFGDAWSERPLWLPTVCLETGERLALGRPDAPMTDVGTAVIASGAVPGVCEPVRVGARSLIDGGVASQTHLDLLHDAKDELIVVCSPLSIFPPLKLLLRREIAPLRARGRRVLVCEPDREASRAMGLNVMEVARGPRVVHAAYRAARRLFREPKIGALLAEVFDRPPAQAARATASPVSDAIS